MMLATRLYAPESGTVLQVKRCPRETASAPGTRASPNPATNGGSAIANGFIVIGNKFETSSSGRHSVQSEDVLLAAQPDPQTVTGLTRCQGFPFPARLSK